MRQKSSRATYVYRVNKFENRHVLHQYCSSPFVNFTKNKSTEASNRKAKLDKSQVVYSIYIFQINKYGSDLQLIVYFRTTQRVGHSLTIVILIATVLPVSTFFQPASFILLTEQFVSLRYTAVGRHTSQQYCIYITDQINHFQQRQKTKQKQKTPTDYTSQCASSVVSKCVV